MNSIYHSLPSVDSIRLLHLQPGVDYEPVAYSLIVIDKYKSAPEYNALSYCWGDANDTTDSFCNGISHPITKSLHAALYYIRRKALPQLIWADAVCINQMNIPERNQQVSIMPQIYQCASRILIWAGHGDEHSTSAISVIRTIGHECCMELYGPSPFPASWLAKLHRETNRTQVVSKTNLTELKNVSQTDRAPFWRFYNSAWFSRVWVIQEVERNPQIHLLCGNEEIEWDFVALAANWVNHVYHRNLTIHWRKSHFPSFGGFHNAFFMWDRSLSTRREAPFPALLNLVRHFDATDSRDKVFALLQHSISQIQTYDLDRNVGVRYPPESPSGVS
jgi:hypothetical protein